MIQVVWVFFITTPPPPSNALCAVCMEEGRQKTKSWKKADMEKGRDKVGSAFSSSSNGKHDNRLDVWLSIDVVLEQVHGDPAMWLALAGGN